jgi:hypothetical protein
MLRTNISKEEAISLLQDALMEPLGLLVYASEPQVFIQALYRARKTNSALMPLQIRQTHEGIAICHEPHEGIGMYYTDTEGNEEGQVDDQEIS